MFLLLFHCAVRNLPLKPSPPPFHFESFSGPDWSDHWHPSSFDNYSGEWQVRDAPLPASHPTEKLIFATTQAAYHALGTRFPEPLDFRTTPLIIQYEVRFLKEIDCGGAYLKLFSDPAFDPAALSNETRYTIMFGPDKCGDEKKVHFIFMHAPQTTGVLEEKHLDPRPEPKIDKINHLYTLVLRPDQTFSVLVDGEFVRNGTLFADFNPPVNPPSTIDDPTDRKPADWVDEEMIEDPDAAKPEDWDEDEAEYIPDPDRKDPPEDWLFDEPRFIPDPAATRPDDWDEDIHGDWEPPTIANPKCEQGNCGEWEPPLIENPNFRGKWTAPLVKNPNYKGVWKPRQIPNPDYFQDPDPYGKFPPLTGAGFELWVVTPDIGFSNVYIGTDEAAMQKWNEAHFLAKHKEQESAASKLEDKGKAEGGGGGEGGGGSAAGRTPQPNPTLRDRGEGVVGALTDFALNVWELWLRLYRDNPEATAIVTAVAIGFPLILFGLGCCSGEEEVVRQVPRKKRTPEEIAQRKARREARRKEKEEKRLQAEAAATTANEGQAAQGSTGDEGATTDGNQEEQKNNTE